MEDGQDTQPIGNKLKIFIKERPLAALFAAAVILVVFVIAYWAIWADSSPSWTGFGAYNEDAAGPRAKTLWEWLGLLIVPAALAAGAYWLNKSQKETELKIAEKARAAEREIADSRQKQATLEAYYDRMTQLLLEHGLRESAVDSEVRSIARARTVAVVKNLDGARNGQLFAFLNASKLMKAQSPIINPAEIDFSYANLRGVNLMWANLRGANLSRADLSYANLRATNLREANLSGAILFKTNLFEADLFEAQLNRADMRWANLSEVNLSGAILSGSILNGADLSGANLSGANLIRANLREALLNGTSLNGANLLATDLREADYWIIEQFDNAETLESTIMPDGAKLRGLGNDGPTYAEWRNLHLVDHYFRG